MDTSSCGFQMSAREIDLLATPEEEFNSRNSISSLLNSAPAAPDPGASLQQSFFEAIASYLDHSVPRSHTPSLNSVPNADNWSHLSQRKGFQRNFNQMADSHIPTEIINGNTSTRCTVGAQVQISAQPTGGNSLGASSAANIGSISGIIGNGATLQQKGYAAGASTSAPPSSNMNADSISATEHLETGEWTQAARSRPNNGSASATDGRLCTDSGTAKVGKKRSRASRRAPTTVLTTDTSNFRAMVQEFTGIPTAPFAATPFPRSRVDFLGPPRSSLQGGGGAPPFLLRPFPHRTSTTPPAANFGFTPPQANSTPPPPNFLLQSLLQAQQHLPKDSISFPSSNFTNKTNGGLLEELGLSVVLPDLVPSDRRPHAHTHDSSACKNMISNYNTMKVGGGGDRVSDRRSSSSSFNLDSSADRNPPRPDRNMVDSWINSSSDAQSLDKLNVQ